MDFAILRLVSSTLYFKFNVSTSMKRFEKREQKMCKERKSLTLDAPYSSPRLIVVFGEDEIEILRFFFHLLH